MDGRTAELFKQNLQWTVNKRKECSRRADILGPYEDLEPCRCRQNLPLQFVHESSHVHVHAFQVPMRVDHSLTGPTRVLKNSVVTLVRSPGEK